MREDLLRVYNTVSEGPRLFSELKELLENKDFRRRVRKIESRFGEFRTECVQLALACVGEQIHYAAHLAVLNVLGIKAKVFICISVEIKL